jgi:serine/threonine-protein kinase RsbW
MNLELHATPEEVMRAVDALHKFGRQHGLAERELFGLCLALEECGSNIVNHAFKRDARQTFHVLFQHTGESFVIELRDHGPAFDPTTPAERKPRADDDDVPGGWGIQLVHRYIDKICYTREGDQNILRLTKRLGGTADQKSSSS